MYTVDRLLPLILNTSIARRFSYSFKPNYPFLGPWIKYSVLVHLLLNPGVHAMLNFIAY